MMVLFDGGFHVGEFSKWCIKKYNVTGVVAIEANPSLLNKNILDIDKLEHFSYWQGALDNTNDDICTFSISEHSPQISTASTEWINSLYKQEYYNKKVNVKTITLDYIINKLNIYPDILKLDIEGYEHRALQKLSYPVNTVFFEFSLKNNILVNNTIQCLYLLNKLNSDYQYTITYFEDKENFGEISSEFLFLDELKSLIEVKANNNSTWGMIKAQL